MARLLALGCLVAGAAAAPADDGDLAALVQREVLAHRSHEQQGRSATGLQALVQASRVGLSLGSLRVKQANPGGLRIKRKTRVHEKGSEVSFLMGPGCTAHDKFGATDCEFFWDESLNFSSDLHLPSGLQVGDEVVIDVALSFGSGNASDAVAGIFDQVFGKHGELKTTTRCSVCDGNCVTKSANVAKDFDLEIVAPTFMEREDLCNDLRTGRNVTDWELVDFGVELPLGPPAEWKLHGKVTVDLSLKRNGLELVGQAVTVDVKPEGGPGTKLAALRASTPTLKGAPEPAAPVEKQRRTLSEALWGIYGSAWGDAIAQAAASQPAPVSLYEKRSGDMASSTELNAVVFRWMDVKVENQADYKKNISMWNPNHCVVEEDKDTVCTVPFNSKATFSLLLNAHAQLEEGSYMVFKVGPKVGGPLGKMFQKFMGEPKEYQLPACGGDATVDVAGQQLSLKLGKCGAYSARFSMPKLEISVPDLANIKLSSLMPPGTKLPFGFNNIAKLPPIAVHAELHFFHSDNVPIVSLKTEVALDHVAK